MSENNDPVTWNYISGQRPQLHLCKSKKTCTRKIIAIMQYKRLYKTISSTWWL